MIRIIYILSAIFLSLFLLDGIFGNFDSVMKNYEKVEKYFTERTIKNESTQKKVKSESIIKNESTQKKAKSENVKQTSQKKNNIEMYQKIYNISLSLVIIMVFFDLFMFLKKMFF